MEDIQFNLPGNISETLIPDPSVSRVSDCHKILDQEDKNSAMDEDEESSADYMVCDSSSRLIPTGFMRPNCTG